MILPPNEYNDRERYTDDEIKDMIRSNNEHANIEGVSYDPVEILEHFGNLNDVIGSYQEYTSGYICPVCDKEFDLDEYDDECVCINRATFCCQSEEENEDDE